MVSDVVNLRLYTEAVRLLRSAGVTVRMVTGDNALTAEARRCRLNTSG